MKKVYTLLGRLFSIVVGSIFLLTSSGLQAQVNYYESFDSGAGSWTGVGYSPGQSTLGSPCLGAGAYRYNTYSFTTTGSATSPSLGTITGTPNMRLKFDYKIVNYSSYTATTGAWGTMYAEYKIGSSGTWIIIDSVPSSAHTSSAACSTLTYNFSPAPGALYVRIRTEWGAGDFWTYVDEVSVQPLVNNNMTLVSVSTGDECGGVDTLRAIVKNDGINSVDSFKLAGTVGSSSFGPINFTGTLTAGQSDTVIIGTYNFASANIHAYQFFTYDPNGATDPAPSGDTLAGSFGGVSGVLTVGGTSPDFTTLKQALDTLKAKGICGSTELRVRQGTYTEQIVLDGGISGVGAGSWLRIVADPANTAPVNYQYNGDALAISGGAQYVELVGLNIKTLGTSYSAVYIYGNNDHITIDSCKLEGSVSTSTSNAYSTIYESSGSTNKSEYFTISNCEILNGSYGMYLYGGSTSDLQKGWHILNNEIKDYYYYGIYNYYSEEYIIKGNYLESGVNSTNYTYPYGIRNYYSDFLEVSYNKVLIGGSYTYAYGIYNYFCDGSSTTPVKIHNNMISLTAVVNATSNVALYNSGGTYNLTQFNSIYTRNNSTSTSAKSVYSYGGTGSEFENNSVFNDGTATILYGSTVPTRDYNNWYTLGSSIGNRTPGSNSVSANPRYADPMKGDLHSNSPVLDSAGDYTLGYNDDIDGDLRDTAYCDIGADEFDVKYNDIAAVSIADQSLCSGPNSILVKVRNQGVDTITSVTIDWAVSTNGGAYTNQTPNAFSGLSLAQGMDTTLTIGTYTPVGGNTYQFRTYTSAPNSALDDNVANDTASSGNTGVAIGTGTYTVGGTSPDYGTIDSAITALMNTGICGPVTLHVRQGTYNEAVTIGAIGGSGPSAWVTIKADPANGAPVVWSNSNTPLAFNGASYVKVEGMELNTSFSNVVLFSGNNEHISITNNKINGYNTSSTSSSYAAIYDLSSSNQAHNVSIENNEITNGSYGIYMNGNSSADQQDSIIIKNNKITGWYYRGIYSYYNQNSTISGNEVISSSSPYTSGVIGVYAYYNYQLTMESNKVFVDAGTGYGSPLYLYYCDGNATHRTTVANNMLTCLSAGTTSSSFAYNYLYYPDYADIVNNSFYGTYQYSSTSYGLVRLYASVSTNFLNNSVYNNGVAQAAYFSFSGAGTKDYNNLYSTGSSHSGGTTMGSNSMNVDPVYTSVSTGNLHSNSVGMDSAGTVLSYITTDIDGDSRNTSFPDIGADEFDVIYRDVLPVSIADQVICAGSNSILVKVKNLGIDTVTSVTLNWMASTNNGTFVTQTPSTIIGLSLATGDEVVLTAGSFTASGGNSYRFKAFTSMPNGMVDQAVDNDTTLISDSLSIALSAGTYTVGGTSPDYATIGAAIADAESKGICGNVIFNVRQGTYTETVVVGTIAGTGPSTWVTIQADPANTAAAILSSSFSTPLTFSGASYIKVDGLEISQTGSSDVVDFTGNNNRITLSNNKIVVSGTYAYGIYESSGSNMTHNLLIDGNEISGGYYGIYAYGNNTTDQQDSIVIKNNKITDWSYRGIMMYYNQNSTIHNNEITSLSSGSNSGMFGIYSYYNYQMTITNNKVLVNTSSYGAAIYFYYNDGNATHKSYLVNNMFTSFSSSTTNTTTAVNNVYYPDYGDVANNSFYGTFQGTSSSYGLVRLYGSISTNFVNNSIFNDGSGLAMYSSFSGAGLKDYNNVYSTGSSHSGGTSLGSNTVSGNPSYINPSVGDLHSDGSLLDSAGLVTILTVDYDGDARNASFPDIGADEYTAYYDDAGIFVMKPNVCATGDSVLVAIKNFGIDTLTSATVNWMLSTNGGTYVAQTPVSWTGSLAKYESDTFTLTNMAFVATNTYSVKAFTTLPNGVGDQRIVNDTNTQALSVNANTVVTFTPPSACIGAAPFAPSASPTGGTYSGTGIYGNMFYTDSSGTGTFAISYEYLDGNGCVTNATANQVVDTLPTVSAPTYSTVCSNTPAFALSGGLPVSGTYSGTGITSNQFDAVTAGSGSHLITYTYTDGNGCANSDTNSILVNTAPTVTMTAIADQCANNSAFTITGGSPASGIYTVNNVVTNTFNPSSAGVGSYTFKYNYASGNSCKDSAVQVVLVNALPSITNVVKSNLSACGQTDGSITITSSGGNGPLTYSIGSTYQSSNSFTNLGTGTYTPSVMDSAGCSVSDTNQTVSSPSAPSAPVINNVDTYCLGDNMAPLIAVKATGASVKWYSDVSLSSLIQSGDTLIANSTVGTHTYYAAQTLAGCESPGTKAAVKVNPLPTVTFSGLAQTCSNSSTFSISGGAPNGGTYSGTGVTSGSFNPGSVSSGNHVITYSFTDLQSCTNTDTSVQVVNPAPTASISALPAMCLDSSSFTLSNGSPSGGGYYGPGVFAGVFNAGNAGAGSHTLKYVYTDIKGCKDSVNTTVVVDALPVATFSSLADICKNAPAVTLTQGSATPTGGSGTYFGTGVTSGSFNPASLSAKTSYSLSYAYIDGNGCKDTATSSIYVDSVPVVTMTNITKKCIVEPAFTLSNGKPVGGTYSGNGVSSGMFTPSVAGHGNHTVKYVYSDANGCTDSTSKVARVDSMPVITMAPIPNVCENSTAFILSSATATPTGGVGGYAARGLSNGIYDPAVAKAGMDTVVYIYTGPSGCKDTAATIMTVDTVPIVSVTGIGPWCAYDTNTVLVGGMPAGGTYSGTGVSSGSFNPGLIGAGLHTIGYSFTDANSCTDSTTYSLTVNALPNVILSLQRKICLNSTALVLNGGTPKGTTGVYTGNNVSNGSYQPVALTVDTITYTYQDGNGCINSDTKVIRVDSVPTMAMAALPHFCEGESALAMNQGTPAGGVYSGSYVFGNLFDPSNAGSYSVTYTYTDGNGCLDSASSQAVVDTVPVVTIGLIANSCSNSPAISLVSGMPANGTYSGPGVTGSTFDPKVASPGNHTIQYYFVDANNCADSATTSATVRQAPTVTVSAFAPMCVNDDPHQLVEGSPIGVGSGTWKGPGVNLGVFTPSSSLVGNNTISYVYFAPNGCGDSTSQVLRLDANPTFDLGADVTSCGDDIKTLDAGISNVTYQWSNGEKTKTVLANKSGAWTCFVIDTATAAKCTFNDTVNVNYEAVCTGISEGLAEKVSVRYYPNPSSGVFTAELAGFEGKHVDMVIVNMQGQVVYQIEMDEMPVMFVGEIDLGNEPSGMYFINLFTPEGSVSHRISLNR
ncbi:MAG: right-handed parallel beta-helix repeat-containing protein [Flavobacteriales bacterium]|nr:right-handed parallel beta-helix repeat-containing protein [Flavobacteriales bacterium]